MTATSPVCHAAEARLSVRRAAKRLGTLAEVSQGARGARKKPPPHFGAGGALNFLQSWRRGGSDYFDAANIACQYSTVLYTLQFHFCTLEDLWLGGPGVTRMGSPCHFRACPNLLGGFRKARQNVRAREVRSRRYIYASRLGHPPLSSCCCPFPGPTAHYDPPLTALLPWKQLHRGLESGQGARWRGFQGLLPELARTASRIAGSQHLHSVIVQQTSARILGARKSLQWDS